jgi:hypothetical protein
LIFVNPQTIEFALRSEIDRAHTGRVMDGDWDERIVPLDEVPKVVVCRKRFVGGLSWEEAGAYDLMRQLVRIRPGTDGCYTDADIVRRYENLDALYRDISAEGRLRTRKQLLGSNVRELGGVYVHINRHGQVIFGGGGCHRLAISQLIGLQSIPVQVGVVHRNAIDSWQRSQF